MNLYVISLLDFFPISQCNNSFDFYSGLFTVMVAIDLLKVFDTSDHKILNHRKCNIGFSDDVVQ